MPKIAQEYDLVNRYAPQLATLINQSIDKVGIPKARLLNLGCGVGRLAFELGPCFEQIDAIDFSAQTIQHAVRLQQQKDVRYITVNEGELVDYHQINLSDFKLSKQVDNILFSQGDASNLKQKFTDYNIIVIDQVLENSYQPKQVLANVIERLLPHSLLIVASSYCFNELNTAKESWLGGVKVNGENVTGFDGLHNQLAAHFTLIDQQALTTINKINLRQFLTTSIDVTVWMKGE